MLPTIQFTGHNVEVSDIMRNFVKDKFDRLKKHSERITSIHVILNVDKLLQIAEAKVHIPGNEIYASAESDDMYKTIDILIDKLVRQLDKVRGKNGERYRE
jgi:putative sigma-54 modulation protein